LGTKDELARRGINMVLSLVLIEGESVSSETLRSVSLGNAKQLVIGNAEGFGVLLHIAAESLVEFDNALRELARISGVTGLLTLALRTT
jgi:hypothetical protein